MTATPPRISLAAASHPIMDCAAARQLESKLLAGEGDEWRAMLTVGDQLARALRLDLATARFPSVGLAVLALIGKGHNGGDALLALNALVKMDANLFGDITLALATPSEGLRPNTARALSELQNSAGAERARIIDLVEVDAVLAERSYDLCLDGLLGMQFRPPLRDREAAALAAVNQSQSIRLRVAVDLPSGVGDERSAHPFRADITYATGIFKQPLLACREAGLIRYLDIGFFTTAHASQEAPRVLIDRILDPLRGARQPFSDKRDYGHLAIVAGSRSMPGALLMSVLAALRSGVGLVTVFAPESVVAHLAPVAPEAMWRSWPETPEGGLALEGLWQIRSFKSKASALLMGPGMGRERETQALLFEIVSEWDQPIVLDADALRPELVERLAELGHERCVLTPHDGEFRRLSGQEDSSDECLREYAAEIGATVIKKGSASRIAGDGRLFINPTGNAVLARGGSGDLLAGLAAGLLAQMPQEPLGVACLAAYWHGKAADLMALAQGQTACRSTDLLRFLAPALESGAVWNLNSPVSRLTGP